MVPDSCLTHGKVEAVQLHSFQNLIQLSVIEIITLFLLILKTTFFIYLQVDSTCRCITESCDNLTDVCTSTLIPSLTSALTSLATPTNITFVCSDRNFPSAVYDPSSDSMLIFGGVDISSNICYGGIIQMYLNEQWNVSGGEGSSGCENGGGGVRVVTGRGSAVPRGRFHHSAVLIPVSCAARVMSSVWELE